MNHLLQPLILTALICLVIGFSIGYLAGSGQTPKDERLGSGEEPLRSAASQPAAAPSIPAEPIPPVHPLGFTALPVRSVSRPNLNPVNVLARALQPESARSTDPKSIAAQVDEILQEKLAQASPAETRAVRLLDAPGRGVIVMVGLDSYEGVEAVTDAGIRELIHLSVQEWETRSVQS
jgi:hypothetical protein